MKHLAVEDKKSSVFKNRLLTLISRVDIDLYVYIPTYINVGAFIYTDNFHIFCFKRD